jgi:hypothetical protein
MAVFRDLGAYGCRFSLLSRVRLLTRKDLSVTRPAEFCFIEYNFSFISFFLTFGASRGY